MQSVDFFRILCIAKGEYTKSLEKLVKGKTEKGCGKLFEEGLKDFETARSNLEKSISLSTLSKHQKSLLENLRDFNDAVLKNDIFIVEIGV